MKHTMELQKAIDELNRVLKSDTAKYWSYTPYIKTLLNHIDTQAAQIHVLEEQKAQWVEWAKTACDEADKLKTVISALKKQQPIGSFHICNQQVEATTDYCNDGEWPIDNGELLVYAHPVKSVVVPNKKYDGDGSTSSDFDHGWNACCDETLRLNNGNTLDGLHP